MPNGKFRRQFFKRAVLAATVGGAVAALAGMLGSSRRRAAGTQPDELLWLEEQEGARALDWVAQENARTLAAFAQGAEFEPLRGNILAALNLDGRIPWVSNYGGQYYNFWQDQAHPLGLWRRTTPAQYRKPDPHWETVLDLDELSRQEGVDFALNGITPLEPEYRYCLLSLSAGGGDAAEVREFDLLEKRFVPDGFSLPAAKSQVSWISRDEIFVATDFGPDSLTRSGYPRSVRRWRRGEPLAAARIVYEGAQLEDGVLATHDPEPGFERDYVLRMIDSRRAQIFLLRSDGGLLPLDVPLDATATGYREHLLVNLASDWEVGGRTYPAGSLLVANLEAFLAGARDFNVLFAPSPGRSLGGYDCTRDHLILSIMEDVSTRLEILTPGRGAWRRVPLGDARSLSAIGAAAVRRDSNEYFLSVGEFLRPPALYCGDLDTADAPELLKQESPAFDAQRYEVSQHFAVSQDGTRVPYFQLSRRGIARDGSHPTLLTGYGGFEEALLPEYLGAGAIGWLERGGVHVVANIRGGGEYGPQWHQAALKRERHRAYEDFAAVAQDLVARGITVPARLGARGGSNGGLLVGNMLIRYPELFGGIVCEVPLLDMQRYTRLGAGASWIAEYGDPELPEEWAFLKTYSPFHNLRPGMACPPVLFCTAVNDDRTHPAHARKMAARMRQMGLEQAYFYESDAGGHGGSIDNEQAAFSEALVSEFLWRHLAA